MKRRFDTYDGPDVLKQDVDLKIVGTAKRGTFELIKSAVAPLGNANLSARIWIAGPFSTSVSQSFALLYSANIGNHIIIEKPLI